MPKRGGTKTKAEKSQKRQKADKEKPVAEEQAEEKAEQTAAEEATAASEEVKPEEHTEEPSEDVKEVVKEDKAEEKTEKPAKGRGRKKAAPLVPGTKRVTRSNPGPKEDEEAEKKAAKKVSAHIIIEHFKQYTFKRRAEKIKAALLEEDPNLDICFNPENIKPAEGSFLIRDDSGRIFLELKDSKPFNKVKDMDVDETVKDVMKQLK